MPEKIDYKKTAAILTAGEPMAFKAYPDGSLVVIAHDGQKHRFTAEQVIACTLLADVQPKPDPKPKPAPKRARPSKTESKINKGG
jgi:hypothetical protein